MRLEDAKLGIVVDGDFDCASAGEIRRIGSGQYVIGLRTEEPPQWFVDFLNEHFGGAGVPKEYSFCARVANKGDERRQVTLRFEITGNCGNNYVGPPNWIRRSGNWLWIDPADTAYEADRRYVDLSAGVNPGESVWLASAPFVSPAELEHRVRRIADSCDPWQVREIGSTARGRPILALESGPRPTKLVAAATMQSAEPVSWGFLHLAHWLALPSQTTSHLLENIQFCLLPMTNPDGAAEGRSVTNSLGEVPKFSLADAARGRPAPKEIAALWDYLNELRPAVYFENHMHCTWSKPMVRRFNPVDGRYAPESMRASVEAITSSVMKEFPHMNLFPLDPRREADSCYGTSEMVEMLGCQPVAWQGIPDSIESHCAEVQKVIEIVARCLIGD